MQTSHGGRIVATQVLKLVLLHEVLVSQRLESDEQAAQTGVDGALEQVREQHGVDGPRRLPQSAHSAHAVEERGRKAAIAEEVIVEEIEVPAWQSIDLRQRSVDGLGVEGLSACEERFLVAEVADVRASPRHDDRIRHEIQVTLDQVASDRRQPFQRSDLGSIDSSWALRV